MPKPYARGVSGIHAARGLTKPGAVVRCRACTGILMAFGRVRAMVCVDLTGLAAVGPAEAGTG